MSLRRVKYNLKAIVLSALITEVLFWLVLGAIYFVLLKFVPTIRFHNPKVAWGLLLVPAISIIYVFVIRVKNKSIAGYSDKSLVPKVIPGISTTRAVLKFLCLRFGLAFLVIAIIDPKVGTKMQEFETQGIDLMICLDVSNSMLAEDIQPTRLEGAKRSMYKLISSLDGDRVGIIVFAGNAFVQLPITSDYEAAKLFLETIDTDITSIQGTAIGAAIDLAMESFDLKNPGNKAIIVITDGENHEDDALGSARRAAAENVTLHAIGMGSIEGAPIPIYNRYGQKTGFKSDSDGNTVVTALNENMLREIVEEGGGILTRASGNYVGIGELISSIQQEEGNELQTFEFAEYEHRFQWFLAAGLFLLLLDILISERMKNWSKELSVFDV